MTPADEPQLTGEQVMACGGMRPEIAERIAVYANLRAAGVRRVEAARELDVTDGTANRYERWVAAYRKANGLPPLRYGDAGIGDVRHAQIVAQSRLSAHQRWHAARGVTKPGCLHCQNTASEAS